MALTDFGANTAMQKKVWALETWKQARDQSFFFATGLMGSGNGESNKPVTYVKDLTRTSRGDKCVVHLIPDMQTDGIVGDNLLKGNEEAMVASTQEIQIDQLRNAIANAGRMSEQKTVIRTRENMRDMLGNWHAQKIDEIGFLVASGKAFTLNLDGSTRSVSSQLPSIAFAAGVTAPSTNRQFFAGTATSTATIAVGDKITWKLIVGAVAFAKRKRIKPVRYNGKEKFALVLSTEQARDLKTDTDYMTNVGRAGVRGDKNPLFNGYFADIDDCVLFDHPKVFNTLGAASGAKFGAGGTINGAQSLLLGAQALAFARPMPPTWGEDADDDHGNRQNASYATMIGYKKPVFTSIYDAGLAEDFSVISVFSAAGVTV